MTDHDATVQQRQSLTYVARESSSCDGRRSRRTDPTSYFSEGLYYLHGASATRYNGQGGWISPPFLAYFA